MGYSEHDIELIRDRLLQYYKHGQSREPNRTTWSTLADEVGDKTGITINEEALRIFVLKSGGRVRVPRREHVDALVSFLSHPDNCLLSRDELAGADSS